MPTTLTGLLLFVVMLLPGFAYLVGKERNGTERRLSPFRETVAIVCASVSSELVALGIFAAIRVLWPSITPNVGALLSQGGLYFHGDQSHHGHYQIFAAWGVALLILAMSIAYAATIPSIRRIGERLTGPYPHDSTVSSWWIMFERWGENRNIELACLLTDGSAIRGRFGSFNISAEDSPDRDLILKEPIYYRPPGDKSTEVLYDVSAVCCSASRIVALFVNYSEPEPQNVTPVQELGSLPSAVESAATTTSAASTRAVAPSSPQPQA